MGLDLPWMNRIYRFYGELDVGLLAWIHHHRGWCWWLMKKMGCMMRSTWNSFPVSSNKSYFVYVNLMENFPQNSPSIIWSSMYLSSVDKLIYGGLPSLYNSAINGRVFLYVLVLGLVDISLAMLWTMTQGWVILMLVSINTFEHINHHTKK